MDAVGSHRVAESPGDRRTRERSVACHRELPAGEAPLARGGVDEDRGAHARREDEATDPGPVGDGELHPHPVGKGDGVGAGRGRLRFVRERGFELTRIGVRRLRDRPGKGHDREVLEGGAARTREMGEAEAVDGIECVEVAAGHRPCERGARGVGTPLDHPERDIGARKGADRPDLPLSNSGADERVDGCRGAAAVADRCCRRRSGRRGASRRCDHEGEQQGDRTAWCPEPCWEDTDPGTPARSIRHKRVREGSWATAHRPRLPMARSQVGSSHPGTAPADPTHPIFASDAGPLEGVATRRRAPVLGDPSEPSDRPCR